MGREAVRSSAFRRFFAMLLVSRPPKGGTTNFGYDNNLAGNQRDFDPKFADLPVGEKPIADYVESRAIRGYDGR